MSRLRPNVPMIFSARVAPRHLGARGPILASVAPRDAFHLGDDRLAGADDFLLIRERFLRMLARKEIEIGFADALFGRGAKRSRVRRVVAHKPALEILEIDSIGGRIHQ